MQQKKIENDRSNENELNEQKAFYSVRSCRRMGSVLFIRIHGRYTPRRIYGARQLWITLETEHNVFNSSLK